MKVLSELCVKTLKKNLLFSKDLLKPGVILCCKVQSIFLFEVEIVLLDITFNIKLALN